MTITEPTTPSVDEEALGAFSESLFGAGLQMLELVLVHLGRRLGLYEVLRGAPRTSGELAAAAGIDERYAREWLEQQAMSGTVTVEDVSTAPDGRRYSLPEEHAIVLLDEEHPAYSGALADGFTPIARTFEDLVGAFRTGAGVPFADYHLHDMQAGFTRPMFANELVASWIPVLPDVHARLEAGDALHIADIGCGEGWAAIYLAEAYPHVRVDGYDLDDASIAAARKHASERGVSDRVHFEVQDITADAPAGYDLVLAVEVIHDLSDPVDVLSAMDRISRPDGTVLIVDENAADAFSPDPEDPIQRLLYAFSVLHCLPAGRTHEHSAATGTVMRPDTFTRYATEAGFATVEVLPLEHPIFRFYRLGR